MAQVLLAVQIIVNNAMQSKLDQGGGELGDHVGAAFDAYCTKYENELFSHQANAIHTQLVTLGFRW